MSLSACGGFLYTINAAQRMERVINNTHQENEDHKTPFGIDRTSPVSLLRTNKTMFPPIATEPKNHDTYPNRRPTSLPLFYSLHGYPGSSSVVGVAQSTARCLDPRPSTLFNTHQDSTYETHSSRCILHSFCSDYRNHRN